MITTETTTTLPSADADWTQWRDWGLSQSRSWSRHWGAPTPERTLTIHAYREEIPGERWKALYDATWTAYRAWYVARPDATPMLEECREALIKHMPELLPTWERLGTLANDPLAARMLSMWNLPAFAVGCSQIIIPGERPVIARNYDYDPLLFEGVIASTNYSGQRRVIGTSDLLWGLLDGMNEDGLAVSLTYGGRLGHGDGFGIPLVIRYVLETCTTVEQAVTALKRLPIAQSYNIALADRTGAHATVFVAPGEEAVVSTLTATTNHKLGVVERPVHAARFKSVERQELLLDQPTDLVEALLTPPLRSEEFEVGFGTLYTVVYEPGLNPDEAVATWHWPTESWARQFDDSDEMRTVILTQ